MKKIIFVVLMLFGFNAIAEMSEEQSSMDSGMEMNQMTEMVADSSEEMKESKENGFVGSFSLRYQPLGQIKYADDLSYRARVGWKGEVNDQVKWGVVLSTNTEQNFLDLGLQSVNLEKAYISYNPFENLYVKVGKMSRVPDFHKVGVLYSEQIYSEGAKIKYKYEIGDNSSVFAKVGAYRLTKKVTYLRSNNMPLQPGTTLEGKLGAKFSVANFDSKVYVKGVYDGLFKLFRKTEYDGLVKKEDEAGNVVSPGLVELQEIVKQWLPTTTLVQAGLMVGNSDLVVPAGVFVHYLSDVEDLGDFSYTAGLSVGSAGKMNSTEAGDFGVAVSYYDVKEADYRQAWLNEDYFNFAGIGGKGENIGRLFHDGAKKGVAARVQYNIWDKSSLVLKYAFDLSEDKVKGVEEHNLVAELAYVF